MQNKGLPTGAGQWARDLDAGMAKLKEIEAIARRLCADFGLDFADPSRGLGVGPMPSVNNPVQLKLPSLQDLDIRDAQDGDILTFDGSRGKWVARRHNTVQQPKTFPLGDPDSYYAPPVESYTLADTPSIRKSGINLFTDPSFETGVSGWSVVEKHPDMDVLLSNSGAQAYAGSGSMRAHLIAGPNPAIPGGTESCVLRFTGPTEAIKSFNLQAYLPADGATNNPSSIRPEIIFRDGEVTVATFQGNVTRPAGSPAGWYWGYCDTWYEPTLYDSVELRIVITVPINQTVDLWFDEMYVGTDYPVEYGVNFNGSTPDSNDFDYVWNGPVNASTSTGTQRRQITAPGTVPVGTPAQVLGTGFNAGESVTLTGGSNTVTVTAESDGTFDARLPIASGTPLGAGVIEATGSFTPSPTVNVTFS